MLKAIGACQFFNNESQEDKTQAINFRVDIMVVVP